MINPLRWISCFKSLCFNSFANFETQIFTCENCINFRNQNLYLRQYCRSTNTNDESQVKKFRLATSQIIQIVLKLLWPTLTTDLQQAKHNIFRFRSCTNMQGWVLPVPEIVVIRAFAAKWPASENWMS